jgi:Xaa-Pro aminopeptidase
MKEGTMLILFSGSAHRKSMDQYYPHFTDRNFWYFTGVDAPNQILVMSYCGKKKSEWLFIEESDPAKVKWEGSRIQNDEAAAISGIENIRFLSTFDSIIHNIINSSYCCTIALDFFRIGWDDISTPARKFHQELSTRYPYLQFKNAHPWITELRLIKSAEEINEIIDAIDLTDEAIREMAANLEPGAMEYEIEAIFRHVLLKDGVREPAFSPIIASGINATTLHYEDNDHEMQDGDLILFDVGACRNQYNSDISRTFPVNGTFSERQKKFYEIVLTAVKETQNAVKPGVSLDELNNITKKVLATGLLELGLIEKEEEVIKYYFHGVSHLLGLDTHDVGGRAITLKEGMVITVEPGLYIEEESIGIRLENDVLVTADGHINLSEQIPIEVEDVERLVQGKLEGEFA